MKTWFYIVAMDLAVFSVAIKATKDTVRAEFARQYPHTRILSIDG